MEAEVEDQRVSTLLDTGSQATLISLSTIKRLRLEERITPTAFRLSSFTHDHIRTVGEIKLTLTIAGARSLHPCIVVPEDMDCSILLGSDFMTANNISIHMGKGKVTSDLGSTEFVELPRPISKRSKIRLAKTTVIPPNSLLFITGRLTGKQNLANTAGYSGYLEPYYNTMMKKGGLLIGSSISNSVKGMIPVRCINSTEEPMILHRQTLLGFLSPCHMDSDFRGIEVRRITSAEDNTTCSPPPVQKQEWSKESLFTALRVQSIDIPVADKLRLKQILWTNKECFSVHDHDLGTCNFYRAEIKLKPDHRPKWTPSRPIAYKLRGEMEGMIQGMLDSNVIEELQDRSYWNSPVMLVKKPNGSGFRFVADFRSVNAECLPDGYQLPNVNHVVDTIGGCNWYSTFDLSKSFYQVEYDHASKPITAFAVNNKRYVFRRLVMGHLSSSSQFSRMIEKLVQTIPIDQLVYFLDDLLLASHSIGSHLDKLELVLQKFRQSNLKLTPKKCQFLRPEVTFVGLTISKAGMRITDDRSKAATNLRPPSSVKELERVMGFLAYNRKFVPNFAALAKPLYSLIDRKPSKTKAKFHWSKECDCNFEEIKRRIGQGITLSIPDVEDKNSSFEVKIDASLDGLGAQLSQEQEGTKRTVAYFSKRVPQHKRTWGQTRLEFEAMLAAIEHWRVYLEGTHFTVVTDCKSLLDIGTLFSKASAHQVRQLQRLAKFRFEIEHISGTSNTVCDFLSRYGQQPTFVDQQCQTELPADAQVLRCTRESTPEVIQAVPAVCEEYPDPEQDDSVGTIFPPSFFDPAWHANDEPPHFKPKLIEDELPRDNAHTACICKVQSLLDHRKDAEVQVNAITRIDSDVNEVAAPQARDLNLLRQAQKDDPILQEVRKWIDAGSRPDSIQALRAPPDLVRLWKQFHLLTVRQGLLARKWIKHHKRSNEVEVERKLYLVPDAIRHEIMVLSHGTLLTMHPGAEETLRQCQQHFYWPKMADEIKLFVDACIVCGKAKQPSAYLKAPLKHVITHDFNDVLVIDHVVPERDIATPRGNRYILTITDLFTGYLLALPAKTKTSEETIRLIHQNWCSIKGYPREIISDNDPGFTSTFYNAVLSAFNIKSTHGTPYKCSSTSKAERSNKKINKALRTTLNDKQIRDWDIYLKWVCFALNSLKSRHTGFSPNRLLYGKEINSPLSILVTDPDKPEDNSGNPQARKAYQLHRTIKELVRRARINGAADFMYADNLYNRGLHGPYFKKDEWCFVLKNCPAHKFSMRWMGPFRIEKVVNDHLYYVDLGEKGTKLCNISKLKHYRKNKYSPQALDPLPDKCVPAADPNTRSVEKEQEARPTTELEPDDDFVATPASQGTVLVPESSIQLQEEFTQPSADQEDSSDQSPTVDNLLAEPDDGESSDTDRRYPSRDRRPADRFQAGF